MYREIFYKVIRAAIFPFRFLYLIFYQWQVDRQRQIYLDSAAGALRPVLNGIPEPGFQPSAANKKGDDSDIPSV